LFNANGLNNCNFKLIVFEASGRQKSVLYINKSYYPSEDQACNGVPVGLVKLERHDPNAKIINTVYKQEVNDRIQKGNFFEVLLINKDGKITEGSKSNVFFVKNGQIYTAPGDSVLKGVTRKYVLEACRITGCGVFEEFVDEAELPYVEGAFLSGTSIKALPIASIEKSAYNTAHPVIIAVREVYDRLVKKYIEDNVNIW
jgi:branched-chain amino acid aminotransferase